MARHIGAAAAFNFMISIAVGQEFHFYDPGITSFFGGGVSTSRQGWADFDKDGDLDYCSPKGAVFRNMGAGKFTPTNLAGSDAQCMGWGDADKDGILELAILLGPSLKLYAWAGSQFAERGDVFPAARFSSWSDFDADGRDDLLLVEASVSTLFRATATGFEKVPTEFPGGVTAAWKDFNGDGRADFALAAEDRTYLYRNLGSGQFAQATSGLAGLGKTYFDHASGHLRWGDLDGDKAFDLLVLAESGTKVYRNLSGSFAPVAADLPAMEFLGAFDLGDFDGDKDDDVLFKSRIYSLQGNGFADRNLGLSSGAYASEVRSQWSDLDKDGDLDIVYSYTVDLFSCVTLVLRNDGDTFRDIRAPLRGTAGGIQDLIDFDSDGDTDIYLTGLSAAVFTSMLYRNDLGGFALMPAALPGSAYSKWDPADFDGDGRMDLAGRSEGLALFRNLAAGFVPLAVSGHKGEPLSGTCFSWGDFDSDGRIDFTDATRDTVRWFRNTGNGGFIEAGAIGPASMVVPEYSGDCALTADFDADGDLDLLLNGTLVYLNHKGQFKASSVSINSGLNLVSTLWTDLTGDGAPDLLECGRQPNLLFPHCRYYKWEDGDYRENASAFLGMTGTSVAGDFDNDGFPDILMVGERFETMQTPAKNLVKLYKNHGSDFSEGKFNSEFGRNGSGTMVDFDNDGDLDLAVPSKSDSLLIYRNTPNGFITNETPVVRTPWRALAWFDQNGDGRTDLVADSLLYLGRTQNPNAKPSPPASTTSNLEKNGVLLEWSAGTDPETPSPGLTYNVRVGTTPGGSEVVSAPADPATGRHWFPRAGRNGHLRRLRLRDLGPGTYYWTVQAIDAGWVGSAFAAERSFTLGLSPPSMVSARAGNASAELRWAKIDAANFRRYLILCDTVPNPARVADSTGAINDTTKTLRGLLNGKRYWISIAAEDQGRNLSLPSPMATTVPDGEPPGVPSGFKALADDRAVMLEWLPNPEPDLRRYLLFLRSEAGAWVPLDSVNAGATTRLTVPNLQNGHEYVFALSACDTVGNCGGMSPPLTAMPSFLVSASAATLEFGAVRLGQYQDTILYLDNSGSQSLSLSEPVFSAPGFSAPAQLASLGAHSSTPFTLRFQPTGSGGEYRATVRVPYQGTNSIEIAMAGRGIAGPFARILGITPADLPWDTSLAIQFSATASDSDIAGAQPAIRAYLWSSDLSGDLPGDAGFSLRSSGLAIGSHRISLRVIDNEGDTSDPVSFPLVIRNRKPLARIDLLTPHGLILRGGEDVHVKASAFDADEGASAERDDLASFGLYSTSQGLLSRAKETRIASDTLKLGLHGFYLKAVDDEGDTSFSDTVWIPVQPKIGHGLIVAGTAFNDHPYFFMNIAPNGNWAYGRLLQRGFSREQLHYLNPIGWQGLASPYENSRIVEETDVSLATLRRKLQQVKGDVAKGVPLLLTLIGHGQASQQQGKFYLGSGEALLPDTLSAWLDALQADSGTPLIVLLDFCYAGSFFPRLLSAKQNRVLIASSAADKQAYFVGGRGFSYTFFNAVQKGKSVTDAFLQAQAWSDANAPSAALKAEPWLSGNPDILYNQEADLGPLRHLYIGGTQQYQSVGAEWTRLDVQALSSEKLKLHAAYAGHDRPDTAWYALLDYGEKDSLGTEAPWKGGRMLWDSAQAAFVTEAQVPAGSGGEVLVTVFGQVGSEAMMPLSQTYRWSTGMRQAARLSGFSLGRNAPNPFTAWTRIPYHLARTGWATLKVTDLQGRLLRVIDSGTRASGGHVATWDGTDGNAIPVPSGLYLVELSCTEGNLRRLVIKR